MQLHSAGQRVLKADAVENSKIKNMFIWEVYFISLNDLP